MTIAINEPFYFQTPPIADAIIDSFLFKASNEDSKRNILEHSASYRLRPDSDVSYYLL
jgi:hypothetical protein